MDELWFVTSLCFLKHDAVRWPTETLRGEHVFRWPFADCVWSVQTSHLVASPPFIYLSKKELLILSKCSRPKVLPAVQCCQRFRLKVKYFLWCVVGISGLMAKPNRAEQCPECRAKAPKESNFPGWIQDKAIDLYRIVNSGIVPRIHPKGKQKSSLLLSVWLIKSIFPSSISVGIATLFAELLSKAINDGIKHHLFNGQTSPFESPNKSNLVNRF